MMEMDSNELERFLAASSGGFNIAQTLSTQNLSAQAAAAGIGSQNGGERSGSVISPDQSSGSVDMDEIVAENDREMRRRSLANGFGMDFLNVTDTDPGGSFSQMVSPTYSQSPILAELSQISSQMSSTMEGYSGLSSTSQQNMNAVAMMGVGNITGSELSSSMPMYSDQQSTAHQNSGQNGLVAMSVAPTSAVKMASGPLASSPNTSRMSGSSMSHTTIPPQMHMPQISEAPSIDRNSTADPMTDIGAQYTQMETKPQPSIFNETTYSSTGFDMLGILYQVANRPNPQINIGCVDLSCSFVVTDARKFDNPIVYCSSTFERLTGYTKHEILGRNCRFLQAPDGKIVPGVKRKYVDDDSVYYIKNRIMCNKEAQTSLINYRKGGQSFTNLLTMIPIAWNSPDISHFVGFQVDLVDQPGAMVNKNRDGTYSINYQYSQMPTYIPTGTATVVDKRSGTTVARDDVTQVLSSFGTADSEFHSKRILDKVLLENTDDVVHVLSLKGLFLYCSQSVRKVLEYDPQELVGSSLSGICHPSDIVPVTRDLKDTSAGSSVNVVFRIRRKYSGYTWFESHGCLHTEQGKGRKCIILVGRERPVYVLSWRDITASGGIGENELWTKMSTSGMFLYVSSNSKMLLDREGEELLGTSIQALMRPDSKNEIGSALENARAGVKATVRHEIQNKRGQFLQALTTLFPGDGNENQRPTFLIAQTRLLKHTRASASSPIIKSVAQQQAEAMVPVHGTASLWSNATPAQPTQTSGERSGSVGSAENGSDGPDDNLFDELKTTRSTSWQFELRQMQRTNKRLIEELTSLLALKKKRKRRKGADQMEKDCANCHTRVTPEWRRGPSGKRDLCNSCGLRYAKLVGRVSPRTTTSSDKGNTSPAQSSALQTAQQQSLTIDTSSPVVSSAGKNPSSHQQQQHPQQQHPHHHPHPHPQHNISMHNPPPSSSNNNNNNTLCSPIGGGSSGGGGGGSGSMQNLAPMPPAQKIRRMSFAGVSSNGMAPIQLHPGSGQQQQLPLSGQMDLGGG